MKKFFPLIFLVLLILSDAFLKEYVHYGRLLSLALFLISSFYFLLYLRDNVAWESFFALEEQPQRRIGIVVLIILAGAFFRFWKLTSLFDGVFWDEAYKGLDALAMREFGEHPIFLDWNAGREALVAYLVACSTTLSGYTTFAVRAVEALAGTITLVFFYLFLREIFAHKIAILGLILLAVSKYHIIYSRFGIRVNLILLFEVATLYFLARGIKSRGKGYASFLMAGVSAGLGFYTYIAYRIFPLVGLAFLVDKAKRHELRKRVPQIATGALVCFLIVAPLGLYFFKNARSFSDRMSRTALWANKKEPLAVLLLKSTRDTIGIFTYRGDMNARHNVASEPGLSPFSSAFFWLGMILLLAKLRKPHALFLFAYFVFMITPGILGADAPHASRNLGALPPAIVLTSIGIFGAA